MLTAKNLYGSLSPSVAFGGQIDLHRLENGDTLLVPPVGSQVTVDGMVRRPAKYELHGENSLSEVLELAGGILPTATLRHIEVQHVEAHEKRTMLSLDLSPSGDPDAVKLDSFPIQDGDEVHVFPIAPYNHPSQFRQVDPPKACSFKRPLHNSNLALVQFEVNDFVSFGFFTRKMPFDLPLKPLLWEFL